KNPAYLFFVKYEHFLAFAGVGVLILQLIFKVSAIKSTEVIICCLVLVLNVIPVLLSTTSVYIQSQSRAPALLLLLALIVMFYFKTTRMVGWLLISELFWRGIYFEVLKRQGFSNYVIILITSILSIGFYLLLFSTFNLIFSSIISLIILSAGILRSKSDLTTVFAFYAVLLVITFLLVGFSFGPNFND
ncbi:MAG TPA: hypothetical protein VEC36_04555, partial [Patescibacteria group bacterium]|nr:hypothetical protein [Patescibacteria group bacterium]